MFKAVYPGMKGFVREQKASGKSNADIFDLVVEKFNYKGSRKVFSNYVYKMTKAPRDTQGDFEGVQVKKGKIAASKEGITAQVEIIDKDGSFDQDGAIAAAIKAANIDLNKWEEAGSEVRFHDTPIKLRERTGEQSWQYQDKAVKIRNWVVCVKFKPKKPAPFDDAIMRAIEKVKAGAIPNVVPAVKCQGACNDEYAGELALYDAHLGKAAYHSETGQGDMDLDICKKVLIDACEKNLNHIAAFNPAKIFYVLGNDFMHFENIFAKTSHGQHQLDVSCRLPSVIDAAIDFMIQSVLMCTQVAPVEVVLIQGNHDLHSSLWLAKLIKHRFACDPKVIVDDGEMDKKARLWGKLLLVWAHNLTGKMQVPTLNAVPDLWPDLWAKSIYREVHGGHKHKKEEIKFMPTQTKGGIIYRQIPALSTIDKWHYDNGFVDAVPAGESFLLSKENGVEAHFTANVNYRN